MKINNQIKANQEISNHSGNQMKEIEKEKIIDVRIINKDKLEAQLKLPVTKGYIEIINKWLKKTYGNK